MKDWLAYLWFRLRGHRLVRKSGNLLNGGIATYACKCGGFMELHFNLFTMTQPLVIKATCPYAIFVKSMQIPRAKVERG